jgi:hypothetical protein
MVKTIGFAALVLIAVSAACGGDESESDRLGVGSQCDPVDDHCDEETNQVCLSAFKGGYCGISGCVGDVDCPTDSACIAHTDGINYCFRTCLDKPECNANRDLENESNCSSSVTFVDGTMGRKACVPPSAGI